MEQVISPVNTEDRKSLGIRTGDTVRVWQKIQEGDKTRLQAFEGVVLARKHGSEPGATFTVRKVSMGVGVEKIFPLYSPMIDKIEIIRRAKVRKAKLYHIRDKAAKEIRRQMRNMKVVNISTSDETEEKSVEETEAENTEEVKTPEVETKTEGEKSAEKLEEKSEKKETQEQN